MKKGFTIIEVLVVCLIIAILASLVIINLDIAGKKSRDSQRKTDLTKIANAMDGYRLEKKIFLATGDFDLVTGVCGKINAAFTDSSSSCLGSLVTDGYISSIPLDPQSNPYKIMSNGSSYKIIIKSETIKNGDTQAKSTAGEFYDGSSLTNNSSSCFQISSDTSGYNFGVLTGYCDNP